MSLNTVSLLEFIDTPAGIHELLSSREEGVALAADIDFQNVHVLSGTGFKGFSARADHGYFAVFGMNIRFHSSYLTEYKLKYDLIISVFFEFVNSFLQAIKKTYQRRTKI